MVHMRMICLWPRVWYCYWRSDPILTFSEPRSSVTLVPTASCLSKSLAVQNVEAVPDTKGRAQQGSLGLGI